MLVTFDFTTAAMSMLSHTVFFPFSSLDVHFACFKLGRAQELEVNDSVDLYLLISFPCRSKIFMKKSSIASASSGLQLKKMFPG